MGRLWWIVALAACSSGSDASLRIDLRTDFVPGIEFSEVRTSIEGEGLSETLRVVQTDEVFDALRVATFDAVPEGNRVVNVALFDGLGEPVADRSIRVSLRDDLGVTVLVTRDCRGVMCPGAGDDPSALTCLGGRCVPLDCTDGTSPECPEPECSADGECDALSMCSTARCVEGTCVYERDDGLCDDDEYCDPDDGCLPVPTMPDAGTDAGVMDAGNALAVLDISPQASEPAGGIRVLLELEGDTSGLEVDIGSMSCTGVTVSLTSASCTVPPAGTGTVDVVVRNTLGETVRVDDGFTYFRTGPYQHGTTQDDNTSGVAVDALGNVYISGGSQGDLDGPNQGDWDAMLVKFDADGTLAWARTLGSPEYDYYRDVFVGPDGTIYAAGYTSGDLDGINMGGTDALLVAYDTDGNRLWVTQTGSGQDDEVWDLGVDGTGNIFLAGRSNGVVDGVHAGLQDAVLWRFDSDGDLLWARQFGTAENDWGHSVGVDPAGHAFLVGYSLDSVQMGVTNQGDRDLFVARYEADGTRTWIRQRGGAGRDEAFDAIVAQSGHLMVSGRTNASLDGQAFAGGNDVFAMRFSPDGAWQWTRQWGSPANEDTFGLSEDAAGDFYVPGTTTGAFDGETNAGGADWFVVKVTDVGDRVWTRIGGSTLDDRASSGATDTDHSELTYLSVITQNDLDGMGPRGMNDLAVTKLDADGNSR